MNMNDTTRQSIAIAQAQAGLTFTNFDVLAIGEFCEKRGPTITGLYNTTVNLGVGNGGLDSGFVSANNSFVGTDDFAENGGEGSYTRQLMQPYLDAFMMRAMSGDHVYTDKNDASDKPLQHRPCEMLIDNVRWVPSGGVEGTMVAFVYSFTLPDVRGRGYTRTVCFSYLTKDQHKMSTIVPWLSREFQTAAEQLHSAAHDVHKKELAKAIEAVERALAGQFNNSPNFTKRIEAGLEGERDSLRKRAHRIPGLLNTLVGAGSNTSGAGGSSSAAAAASVLSSGGSNGTVAPSSISHGPSSSKTKRVKRPSGMAMMASVGAATPTTTTSNLSSSPSLVSAESSSDPRQLGSTAIFSGSVNVDEATPSCSMPPGAAPATPGSTTNGSPQTPFSGSSNGLLNETNSPGGGGGGSPDHGAGGSSSTVSSPLNTLTEDECLIILNQLLVYKGSEELRTLHDIVGDPIYNEISERLRLTNEFFGQDTIWVMEVVLQLMRPLPLLTDHAITDCFTSASAAPSQFFFKVGDFVCVDPALLSTPQFPPHTDRVDKRTILYDEDIYYILRERSPQTIINVAYNALRCSTIVVCGTDRMEIISAMRLASTFIPGIWQSRHHRSGLVGFNGMEANKNVRLTPDHLMNYALIGCPTSAILDPSGKMPTLGGVCVWEVGSKNNKNVYANDKLHGGLHYLTEKKKIQQQANNAAASIAAQAAAVGGGVEGVPPSAQLGVANNASTTYTLGGQLTELYDLLSLRPPQNPAENMCISNYVRLMLKRIFLEYGSMTALTAHIMASGMTSIGALTSSTAPPSSSTTTRDDGHSRAASLPPSFPSAPPSMTGGDSPGISPSRKPAEPPGSLPSRLDIGGDDDKSSPTMPPPPPRVSSADALASTGGDSDTNPSFSSVAYSNVGNLQRSPHDATSKTTPSTNASLTTNPTAVNANGGGTGNGASTTNKSNTTSRLQPVGIPFSIVDNDVREVLEYHLGYPPGLHQGDVAIVTQMIRRMLLTWHCFEDRGDAEATICMNAPPPTNV